MTATRAGPRRVLAAVDEAAAVLGLRPGLVVAHAQALVPDLHLAEAEPDRNWEALGRLSAWCRRYGPLTAPDPPDGVLLEVEGSAHLFGGEEALLQDLLARLEAQSLSARAAIADTPGAAWAAARFGGKAVVPPGRMAEDLADLPLEALRLPRETVEALSKLGIERIGQAAAMPRASLRRRFGAELYQRLDQAFGDRPEPIAYLVPPKTIRARRAFAEPVADPDDLLRIVADLSDALCRELERQGLGVRRLDLLLGRIDGHTQAIRIGTARPSRDPRHLARLLQARLEALDPGFGIEEAVLLAAGVEPLLERQLDADAAESDADEPDLAALVDRLAVKLGPERLYRLAPVESEIPERSVKRVAALAPPAQATWAPDLPRPSRLFDPPEPVQVTALLPDHPPAAFVWRRRHRVVRADGPERVLGEWWRSDAEIASLRDYYRVEDETGARYWLFRDAPAEDGGRWFLHGLFA